MDKTTKILENVVLPIALIWTAVLGWEIWISLMAVVDISTGGNANWCLELSPFHWVAKLFK